MAMAIFVFSWPPMKCVQIDTRLRYCVYVCGNCRPFWKVVKSRTREGPVARDKIARKTGNLLLD